MQVRSFAVVCLGLFNPAALWRRHVKLFFVCRGNGAVTSTFYALERDKIATIKGAWWLCANFFVPSNGPYKIQSCPSASFPTIFRPRTVICVTSFKAVPSSCQYNNRSSSSLPPPNTTRLTATHTPGETSVVRYSPLTRESKSLARRFLG